jgi:hypothetical protein
MECVIWPFSADCLVPPLQGPWGERGGACHKDNLSVRQRFLPRSRLAARPLIPAFSPQGGRRSRLRQVATLADDPDPRQRQGLEIDRVERGQQFGLDRENFRARIAQHVLERKAAGGGVERHRYRAGPGAAQDEAQQFGAITAEKRHPVARHDVGRAQDAGIAGGNVARPSIGPSLAAADEKQSVAVVGGLPAQHLGDGPPRRREGSHRSEIQRMPMWHGSHRRGRARVAGCRIPA